MRVHAVVPGESFFSIAARYHVSPWRLARRNRLSLMQVIVPGQRLALPPSARRLPSARPASRDAVRHALDYWSRLYGVDPQLMQALAWMESGFQQDVVSSVGAIGVMQLPRDVRSSWTSCSSGSGPRARTRATSARASSYLRWQLDHFGGDVRLALAGWYQGARAVREIGLYDDTKLFVRVVLALYGTV